MKNKWTQYAVMAFENCKSFLIRRWNFVSTVKKQQQQPFALFFVQQSQKKHDLRKTKTI